MKHYLLALIGLLLVCGNAFSQTKIVSTYGKHEKPKDYVTLNPGTISLGVGAAYNPNYSVPFLTGISAKYFFNEKWALRANLQFGRKYSKGIVVQEGTSEDTETAPEVEISNTDRTSNFMLNVGFEHRHKLSNRFFGYYGTDLAVGGSGTITRTKENGNVVSEERTNRACDLALLPFIGIEMFLGPKISIGTEFGYNLAFKFYSKNVTKDSETTVKDFPTTSVSSALDFGNSIFAGLRLAYYF